MIFTFYYRTTEATFSSRLEAPDWATAIAQVEELGGYGLGSLVAEIPADYDGQVGREYPDQPPCPECLSGSPTLARTWEERCAIVRALDAEARASELERLFETQTKAAERARGMYQVAHPEDAGAWPDRADLLMWLMERGDKAEQDCAMGKSLQDHFERGREAAIAEAAQLTERAEKAEAEIVTTRQALGDALGKDYLSAESAVAVLAKERDAARAEADALRAERDALRARKVKLPELAKQLHPHIGTTDGQAAYNRAVNDCADAIRAAGVEVEG